MKTSIKTIGLLTALAMGLPSPLFSQVPDLTKDSQSVDRKLTYNLGATNLRCEYLADPLGIDVTKPRLSWVMESARRGERQTAYQVLVASSEELLAKDHGDLWDTGKVESDQSIHVEYAGKALESRMRCYWKVRVWGGGLSGSGLSVHGSDWSKPAMWSMGLLTPEDWQAKWITQPDPKQLAHPWLRRTFEMKEGVERAAISINTASYYELHINGKKVGPYVLEPGITQVNKRFVVNAYDVTSFLVKGTNTIALWMGPGWHHLSIPIPAHQYRQIKHVSKKHT